MTVKRVVIGFAVVVAVLLAIFAALVAVAARSLEYGDHPDVDWSSDEIVDARAAATLRLEAQLEAVERRYGQKHVGPRGRQDWCEAGQYNFTRRDGHAYVCRMQIVEAIPVGKPFRVHVARLRVALAEGGCLVSSSSGPCQPGHYGSAPTLTGWFPARPSPEQLGDARHMLPWPCSHVSARIRDEHCEQVQLDLRAAVAAAPPDAGFLAIVVAGELDSYYEIDWE